MSESSDLQLPETDLNEKGPYSLVGRARALEGFADALEERLLALVPPTRSEQGALAYHIHRDRSDPHLFHFYEAWQSRDDLMAHLQQPYIQAFLADRHRYLEGDLDITWLQMVSHFSEM